MEEFALDSEKVYLSTDYLSLETPDGLKTLMLGEWLNTDPVRIHRMIIRDKTLKVDQYEVFLPLVSKLRRFDPDYYKRIMGLKLMIDFPGYSSAIEAKIPYDTDPIGFYKWWRKGKHEDKIYLSPGNTVRLLQKVYNMEPKVMLRRDIDFLNS